MMMDIGPSLQTESLNSPRKTWSCCLTTTMTLYGYNQFGKKFIETFQEMWPKSHVLHVACEGFLPESEGNVIYWDLMEDPGMKAFKEFCSQDALTRGWINNRYWYQMDALKWSHRIFAQNVDCDAPIFVNIDADIITHSPVHEDFVESLLGDCDLAYMPRRNLYSECSFVVYRMPQMAGFIRDHMKWYLKGKVFELEGWTDCHIFDAMLSQSKVKARNINHGLPWTPHPFVNGPLGAYMDHKKGKRKEEGRSRKGDLIVDRQEQYWSA